MRNLVTNTFLLIASSEEEGHKNNQKKRNSNGAKRNGIVRVNQHTTRCPWRNKLGVEDGHTRQTLTFGFEKNVANSTPMVDIRSSIPVFPLWPSLVYSLQTKQRTETV